MRGLYVGFIYVGPAVFEFDEWSRQQICMSPVTNETESHHS